MRYLSYLRDGFQCNSGTIGLGESINLGINMTPSFKTGQIYSCIKTCWNDRPIVIIMGLAILFRLLAAVFSKGWGMLDPLLGGEPRFPGGGNLYVFKTRPVFYHPQFFFFTGERNLVQRVARARVSFPYLVYEATIAPSFIDELIHWLNPVNKASKVYIYRNREFYRTAIK